MNKFIELCRKVVANETIYEFCSSIYYKHLVKKESKITTEEHVKKIVDKIYAKKFHKKINYSNPITFNEKLNYLKFNWYDQRCFACVDKYLVRDYVKSKGLDFLLNDIYNVYDKAEDINIDDLPDKFVLKTTHDSGMHLIICNGNKNTINWTTKKKKLNRWLKSNYCFSGGEWPYYNKHPRIVCEKFLEDKKNSELLDYKFFCFSGEPKFIFFASDRNHEVKSDFYDLDWNLLPFRWEYEPSGKKYPKPLRLKEMIEYSRILSDGFPFVRVDFYEVDGNVVFGELTFFHGGGFGPFYPQSIDEQLGKFITLPDKSKPWSYIFGENK